ncbi:MAG TPA: HAD-IC family P-type ATPase, partial [Aquabacterium sp.]|nr:HAD-IC family P-type ATPase [Aquabacterium sp.]
MPSPAYRCAAEDVVHASRVDPQRGLASAEVAARQQAVGPNVLAVQPPRAAWRRLLDQFRDPLIYLLLAAVSVSLLVWWIEGAHGWPVDAAVILGIVVLNGLIGYAQEARSEQAAAALARLTEVTSAVRREGRSQRVPSAELVPGDILLLGEGDLVGADARLLSAARLTVQEAALTGESEPVLKDPAALDEYVPPADQRNMVFKGTAVAQGTGVAVVTATGMATEMGAIAAMLAETPRAPTPLQQEIRYLGRTLGGAVLAIAALVIAVAWWQSPPHTLSELVTVWMLGVSLAVAAVPEGLPAIVSIVLALGVQRMARRRAIVKDLASVETLGSASVICSDKTGTLTRSEMTIQRGVTASGRTELSGVGYAPHGAVASAGAPLTGGPVHSEHILLFSGGSLAGNAALHQTPAGDWVVHGDPTEAAFLVAERKLGVHEGRGARFTRVAELPFTSDRKMMSIVALDHAQGDARLLISKGAPDVLLARCDRVRVGLGEQPLSDAIRAQALADVDELSRAALRTLSVAYRPLLPHEDPASGID